MTEYTPIFRSPISPPEATTSASDLGLTDLTGIPISLVQGQAGDILQQHLATVPTTPGDLVALDNGWVACLTPKEFYLCGLFSTVKTQAELADNLTGASNSISVTDFTHAKAALKLTGLAAPQLLSKICGLDFHDQTFPNMQLKQSSAAKIKTLIARYDEYGAPTYHLHVNRSLGQYFWDIVWDAGQEFGIIDS